MKVQRVAWIGLGAAGEDVAQSRVCKDACKGQKIGTRSGARGCGVDSVPTQSGCAGPSAASPVPAVPPGPATLGMGAHLWPWHLGEEKPRGARCAARGDLLSFCPEDLCADSGHLGVTCFGLEFAAFHSHEERSRGCSPRAPCKALPEKHAGPTGRQGRPGKVPRARRRAALREGSGACRAVEPPGLTLPPLRVFWSWEPAQPPPRVLARCPPARGTPLQGSRWPR